MRGDETAAALACAEPGVLLLLLPPLPARTKRPLAPRTLFGFFLPSLPGSGEAGARLRLASLWPSSVMTVMALAARLSASSPLSSPAM